LWEGEKLASEEFEAAVQEMKGGEVFFPLL